MDRDKRKAPRRQLRYTAWISVGSKALHGCVIADISDLGAKLQLEDTKDLPERFALLLSARGRPKRGCRVVWRDETHVGVQFERKLRHAEKSRPILKAEKMTPPVLAPEDPAETTTDRRKN